MNELTKRIITSVFLVFLLVLAFYYSFILIMSLIVISVIAWIEFNGLISKIFIENKAKTNFLKLSIKAIGLIYLTEFSYLVFSGIVSDNLNIIVLYLFLICISSDVGGLIFGKFFKGKKLTKISPNKTISGTIGSFCLSLTLVPIFYNIVFKNLINLFELLIITIFISLISQLGDLFISFLKRKANVKDTSNILPGHGGILDRIDGILFAVPLGIIIWKFLII